MITIADIRAKNPCYDPARYLPEGWSGTLLDVLAVENVPCEDRVWVVTQFLDDKTNRLFAVWCAREALKLVDNPDPRSWAACDVAERFANGQATWQELVAAKKNARAAARGIAGLLAWSAAWKSARAAAMTSRGPGQVQKLRELISAKP